MTIPISPLARVLQQLLEGGRISASQVGRAVLVELRPLLDSGAVHLVRAGAGHVYTATNREAVEALARARFPSGLTRLGDADLSNRERGVMEVRDSKRIRGVGFGYTLLRLVPGVDLVRADGPTQQHAALPSSASTAWAVAVIIDEPGGSWRLSQPGGRIAVIENLDTFSRVNLADIGVSAALFAEGCLSSRHVGFLAALATAGHPVLHVGDYDPVGLEEYLRLKKLIPRVSLHIPDDVETLFNRYSKPSILQKPRNRTALARLRTVTDPTVQRIVSLIDAENGCLEQEVITAVRRAPSDM